MAFSSIILYHIEVARRELFLLHHKICVLCLGLPGRGLLQPCLAELGRGVRELVLAERDPQACGQGQVQLDLGSVVWLVGRLIRSGEGM